MVVASKTGVNLLRRVGNLLARYLCPDLYADSVTHVDLAELKRKGYTTLFIDLDNTLLGWREQEISKKVAEWIGDARRLGYRMQIVSNTFGRRVNRLAALLGISGISTALKPRRRVFQEALRRAGSQPGETVVIGDQMFTDVLGGKRSGLFTILVSPVDRRELFTTGIMRIPERAMLRFFRKYNRLPSAKSNV